jgi:acetyl-CoA C-acetyltransferase
MAEEVAVVGTGQTKLTSRRVDVSMPELLYEATTRALQDADMTIKDIDAVVVGCAPEGFDGVNWPDKWAADAMGAIGKPMLRVHTGGATGGSAALAGVLHVRSGMFNSVLVLAMQRLGQTDNAQRIFQTMFDPLYIRGFTMGTIMNAAIGMRLSMARDGWTEYHMALISAKDHQNALKNPYAHLKLDITPEDVLNSRIISWPLKLLDCCPRSDGACGVVMVSGDRARKLGRKVAWVKGVAASTSQSTPGEDVPRNLGFNSNVMTAYKMAGIDKPREQIQVAEPYLPFSSGEITSYVGLGFAENIKQAIKMVEDGFGSMKGPVPFNPSGGVLCSNPIGATALVRVAEIAAQVMERNPHQVPNVKNGIALGGGGNPGPGSATFGTAMVLGTDLD